MSNSESVETGEIFAKSPLTGNYYLVTEYEDLGDGQIKAKEKKQVDREEVPDDWLEVLDENE